MFTFFISAGKVNNGNMVTKKENVYHVYQIIPIQKKVTFEEPKYSSTAAIVSDRMRWQPITDTNTIYNYKNKNNNCFNNNTCPAPEAPEAEKK